MADELPRQPDFPHTAQVAPSRGLSVVRALSDPAITVPFMLINCDTCVAPKTACADCVVTALLGPVAPEQLEAAEVAALEVLADAGLVRPLRLVRKVG